MKKNERDLYELKNEIINYYIPKFPNFGIGEFNSDILKFPNFKKEGLYHDLTFNKLEGKKCQIF